MTPPDENDWESKTGVGRRRLRTPAHGSDTGPPPFVDDDGALQINNVEYAIRQLWRVRNVADEMLELDARMRKVEETPARIDREARRLSDALIVLRGTDGETGDVGDLKARVARLEAMTMRALVAAVTFFVGGLVTILYQRL